MPLLSQAGRWLATIPLCLSLTTAPVSAAEPPVVGSEILGMLEHWLDANTDLPARPDLPEIRVVSAQQAALIAGLPGRGHGATRGLYDAQSETIYLVHPWAADDPEDLSVLLHELVHHRQAPRHFYCPAAQEEGAYRAQSAWLAELGLKADVNWIAVILDAGCTPRDIHPD